MIRHRLTDEQWSRIEDLVPGKPGDPGRSGKNNRLFVDAIVWMARTGTPWRDLSPFFGKWNSVWKRFRRWAKAGVWDRIIAKHGLRNVPMSELVGESHHYADFCFAYGATAAPPAAFVSTVKIKQAGFGQVYDTEETFRYWLRKLIERKILPPANA